MAESTTTAPGMSGEHGTLTEHPQYGGLAEGRAAEDHGAQHHGLELGRHISHPPEPPHFIQIWYHEEQQHLIKDYAAAHPGSEAPSVVEHWLEKDADGEWTEVPGQAPTAVQVLHIGRLKEPLPLIGYAPWENHAFFGIGLIIVILLFFVGTANIRRDRRAAMKRPTRIQVVTEMIVGGFDEFCKGVLGEENGRKYLPFIGTLFFVILVNNLMGLIPGMRAATSSIVITLSLALCTFLVVQATAWIKLGPANYLHHLLGSPKDLIGWCLSPLFLILEMISDFLAKPLSLSLRLMGNILGKDILLGAFMGMGIALVSVVSEPASHFFGLPLTVPFYFLGLLLSTIQALVFALLSMIYITMVLPHDHDHEDDHADVHDYEAGGKEHIHSHGNGRDPVTKVVHEALPSS